MYILTVKYLLLAIASSVFAIHLTVTWRFTGDPNQLSMMAFGIFSLLSLLLENRDRLTLKAGLKSSLFGGLLIGWIVMRSLSISAADDVLREISPLISGIGVALLASGIGGLKQYWKPLFILAIISVPATLLPGFIDSILGISLKTAKTVTFVLWYLGFDPVRQGAEIFWQTGGVEVNNSCSGINVMILLSQLAGILALRYSFGKMSVLLGFLSAIAIAFTMNVMRVILLLSLSARSQDSAFQYWHHGGGSQLFSTTIILIFGLVCYLLLQREERNQTGLNDADPES